MDVFDRDEFFLLSRLVRLEVESALANVEFDTLKSQLQLCGQLKKYFESTSVEDLKWGEEISEKWCWACVCLFFEENSPIVLDRSQSLINNNDLNTKVNCSMFILLGMNKHSNRSIWPFSRNSWTTINISSLNNNAFSTLFSKRNSSVNYSREWSTIDWPWSIKQVNNWRRFFTTIECWSRAANRTRPRRTRRRRSKRTVNRTCRISSTRSNRSKMTSAKSMSFFFVFVLFVFRLAIRWWIPFWITSIDRTTTFVHERLIFPNSWMFICSRRSLNGKLFVLQFEINLSLSLSRNKILDTGCSCSKVKALL